MNEEKLKDIDKMEYDFGGIDNGSYKLIKYIKKEYKENTVGLPRHYNSCTKCKNAMWFIETNKVGLDNLNSYCRIMNTIKFNSLVETNTYGCAGVNS